MTVALERLLAQGEVYVDPCSVVVWEHADAERPWLPPHLLSVPGLPREQMLRLARLDFARVAAASLWVKSHLVGRSAAAGFRLGSCAVSRLALQEVREAAGHGLMLQKMIENAGLDETRLRLETGRLDRAATAWSTDDLELWAWVYLADSVIDSFVLKVLREGADLCPAARQVLQLHHRDQIRHMAAARALFETRIKQAGSLRRRWFASRLPGMLRQLLRVALFPDEPGLRAIGVAQPQAAARAAWTDQSRRALAAGCAASAITVLRRAGLPVRPGASYPW